MTSRTLVSILGGFAIAVAGSAAAQVGASRTALATVVDTRGRSIVDIDVDDFVVRETGQPREVLSVRVADYPIAVVLDNGPGSAADFGAIREAAARFVGRVGHRPIAIALAEPAGLTATFDDDRAVVLDRIDKARPGSSGTGLLEAIVTASRAITESGSPFSIIVVISAAPVSSAPSELLTPILESGAAVHAIVNGGQAPGSAAETLRVITEQTHGQLTTIFSAVSYQAALDRLADRLAPQLMVEYVVPPGSSSGNDVQLGVRIPGARVIGLGVK
jgi:hypothetical protein